MNNADDRCAHVVACFVPRGRHTARAVESHSFVEPAPQPALSGDEAKVREIVADWRPYVPEANWTALDSCAEDAYAAGKADGEREEREELAGIVAGFIRERERMIKGGRGTKTIIELRVVKQIADAIARRGSTP